MKPIVKKIADEFKTSLQDVYGNDLAELILFGSYARGDQHDESDIDFAVVLRKKDVNVYSELTKTSPVASRLSLKYGLAVSSLPVSMHKKQTSMLGVYREIRKDGIVI